MCAGIFPPDIGGPATYAANLASAFFHRGHEVQVVTYTDQGKSFSKHPFKVIRIYRSTSKILHYLKYFLAVLFNGWNADIIYAQDPVSSGYPAHFAAILLRKPFLLKITGDYSWEQARGRGRTQALIDDFQNLPSYPDGIGLIRSIQISVAKYAGRIITPSHYLKRLVAGWGIAEEKIEVVHNAVPLAQTIGRKQAREALGIPHDKFLAVSAGRDVPWKGFGLIRNLASELAALHADMQFEILHDLEHAKLLQYMAAADVFVLNTGYEGFPHIIWEAMALGTPVVTTNVCGNPEIVNNCVNGILVPYNDREAFRNAILQLYKDIEFRKKLGEKAREIGTVYTLENMVNKTEEILLQCVS